MAPKNHRLPHESTPAYTAFRTYRQLPPEKRSIKAAAEKLGKSVGVLSTWSAKFGWVERVQEYDAKMEDAIETIEENIALVAAKRHSQQAQRLQSIAMDEIERLAELSKTSEIPLLRPEVAVRMVVEGFKMERLVLGQSTENNDNIHRGPLTDGERDEYERYIKEKQDDDTETIDVDFS